MFLGLAACHEWTATAASSCRRIRERADARPHGCRRKTRIRRDGVDKTLLAIPPTMPTIGHGQFLVAVEILKPSVKRGTADVASCPDVITPLLEQRGFACEPRFAACHVGDVEGPLPSPRDQSGPPSTPALRVAVLQL
jgi:hypothetical protein